MRGRNNLNEFECIINVGRMRVQPKLLFGVCCPVCACLCYVSVRNSLLVLPWLCGWAKACCRNEPGGRQWKVPLQPVGRPWLMAPLAFLLFFGHGEQFRGSGEWPEAAVGAVRPSSTMEGDQARKKAEGAEWGAGRWSARRGLTCLGIVQVSPWQRCSCSYQRCCLLSQQHLSAHLPLLRCASV